MTPTAPPSKREICNWLQWKLSDGPVRSSELFAMARENGIPANALRVARKTIGVEAFKSGFQGAWWWGFPSQIPETWEEIRVNREEQQ